MAEESSNHDSLDLTLSLGLPCSDGNSTVQNAHPPPPLPQEQHAEDLSTELRQKQEQPKLNDSREQQPPRRQHLGAVLRQQRSATAGADDNFPGAYEWAAGRDATICSLDDLISRGINKIKGKVICRNCEHRSEIEYDLVEKNKEILTFIVKNKCAMNGRAPGEWNNPALPQCPSCNKSQSMKPEIGENVREINWLFMLLGQSLGCLPLKYLKHFCKYSGVHRSGSKKHVLYYTYLRLCMQLNPHMGALFDP